MKKMSCLKIIIVSLMIAGCGVRGPTSGGLFNGQWTYPQTVGVNQILIQGYDTEDALMGARKNCAQMGGSMSLIRLTPHTR